MSFYRQMAVICGAIVVIIALPIIVAKIINVGYGKSVHPVAVFPLDSAATLQPVIEEQTSSAPAGAIIPAKATPTINASFAPESAPVSQTSETPAETENMNRRLGESLPASETVALNQERIATSALGIRKTISPTPTAAIGATSMESSSPLATSTPDSKPTSDPTPTSTPTPIPENIAIIDISHREKGGYAFGVPTDEVRRWQLFTANFYPYLTQVEVRISKWNGTDQSDVVVELYATQNDHPVGYQLASAIIPAEYVAQEAKI